MHHAVSWTLRFRDAEAAGQSGPPPAHCKREAADGPASPERTKGGPDSRQANQLYGKHLRPPLETDPPTPKRAQRQSGSYPRGLSQEFLWPIPPGGRPPGLTWDRIAPRTWTPITPPCRAMADVGKLQKWRAISAGTAVGRADSVDMRRPPLSGRPNLEKRSLDTTRSSCYKSCSEYPLLGPFSLERR